MHANGGQRTTSSAALHAWTTFFATGFLIGLGLAVEARLAGHLAHRHPFVFTFSDLGSQAYTPSTRPSF